MYILVELYVCVCMYVCVCICACGTCAMDPVASDEHIRSNHAAGEFTSIRWAVLRGGIC